MTAFDFSNDFFFYSTFDSQVENILIYYFDSKFRATYSDSDSNQLLVTFKKLQLRFSVNIT